MNRMNLIVTINLSILLLMVIVFFAIRVAPVFTWSMIGLCAVVLLFILTENWKTHAAGEFENRFWTLMAFLAATAIFFCEDSPLVLGKDQPTAAWICVIVMAFLAHNYERNLRRSRLDHRVSIPRIQSGNFAAEAKSQAQRKVLELRRQLAVIDSFWFSSAFMNLFFLPKVLHVEHQIITIFSEATADELNLIIAHVELARFLYKVKDHKIARRFNRSKLLNLLYSERMSEFVLSSKVLLLDGLQRMKLSAHDKGQEYVRNIIKSTKADELSELKTVTDAKGDINSMHKLLYQDVKNAEMRDTILRYIAQQANVQAAYNLMKSRKGRERGRYAWRKILSDVDDTITCSGGSWPAGMDTSYPKKAVYPGVLGFYRELDLGATGPSHWPPERIGNLVFLSARPHVYSDVSENITYAKFKKLRETRGLYTSPALLAGSLDTGSRFMVRNDIEALARKKYENFREYLTIYPEFTSIFVGDNGQGDVRTAEMILEDARFNSHLQRVYIHIVQPLSCTARNYKEQSSLDFDDGDNKADEKRKRIVSTIYYFCTYVDAAIDAYKHGLIRAEGLRRIMVDSIADFRSIQQEEWKQIATVGSKSGSSNIHIRSRSNSYSNQSQQVDSAVSHASVDASISENSRSKSGFTNLLTSSISLEKRGESGHDFLLQAEASRAEAILATEPNRYFNGTENYLDESVSTDSGSLKRGTKVNGEYVDTSHPPPSTGISEKSFKEWSQQEKSLAQQSSVRTSLTTIMQNLPVTPPMPTFSKSIQLHPISGNFKMMMTATSAFGEEECGVGSASFSSSVGLLPRGMMAKLTAHDATKRAELKAARWKERRLRELNHDLRKGNEFVQSSNLGKIDLPPFESGIDVGSHVGTLFGAGVVTAFRPSDGVYEIIIFSRREFAEATGAPCQSSIQLGMGNDKRMKNPLLTDLPAEEDDDNHQPTSASSAQISTEWEVQSTTQQKADLPSCFKSGNVSSSYGGNEIESIERGEPNLWKGCSPSASEGLHSKSAFAKCVEFKLYLTALAISYH